jgi:exopolysaccharide biosynthesis polyprenyl glycosylphosphotransferase
LEAGVPSFYQLGILRNVQATNVLIVGAGELGRDLEKQILAYQVLGLQVIGFLDDDPTKRANNPDIIGSLDNAQNIILEHNIDEIVIALPSSAYDQVFSMVSEINTLPVKIWVIPDYFNLALHKTSFEEFAGIPMIDLRAPTLTDHQRMIKRAFDLIIILFFLPFNIILMTGISLAIIFEDQGPIIFRQQRVGENGRLFEMLKFRTMVPDAESLRVKIETIDGGGQLIHKQANDPRVTRVGRLLRRMSLDELPQVFNILKGDMSMVGPRPELPYLVDYYEPWQRKRFTVPQGLTGWWQVNGRSDKPMHLHTEDDLYYVYNYSVFLDLLILIKTIGVVLRGEGAF